MSTTGSGGACGGCFVTARSSQQIDVYNETARPIVDAVIEGFNGCVPGMITGRSPTYRHHLCVRANRVRACDRSLTV